MLDALTAWLSDPARWQGPGGIPARLVEHIQLSGLAVLGSLLVALPAGLLIGHTGRGGALATTVANLGRAIPSYALLIVLFPVFQFGLGAPLVALLLLTIPPILTNTYVGLRGVDRDVVEAARAIGLSPAQVLARVEVPLAMPVIVAGVRTAAVQAVATATLAALIAGGGLGRYIVDGFALRDEGQLAGGALLVALLALGTERLFAVIERLTRPAGARRDHAAYGPGDPGHPVSPLAAKDV
jgi:osmoprotectant transport system permease protein